MRRTGKILTLLVLTGFALRGSTSFAEHAQVTVFVYDDAQVPSDTLSRAEQQAAKIFWRAGLDVIWLNCAPINAGPGTGTNKEIEGPGRLVLRIIPVAASSTSDTAFGVAFLAANGTGRYGDVFWERAQELHARWNVDLGGILGSVMAHEMGHLLLGSNAHAMSGIMRAHWESGELRRIAMGTLFFLPEQAKRMRMKMGESRVYPVSSGRPRASQGSSRELAADAFPPTRGFAAQDQ